MLIRAEEQRDWAAVHAVNVSAFETPAEANLVGALREQAQPLVSLIADDNSAIVGHIMFSPVSLSGHTALKIMGLAPMAVAPRSRTFTDSSAEKEKIIAKAVEELKIHAAVEEEMFYSTVS